MFVCDKDMKNNIVYLCPANHPALFCDELETEKVTWISGRPPFRLKVNIFLR